MSVALAKDSLDARAAQLAGRLHAFVEQRGEGAQVRSGRLPGSRRTHDK